MFKLNTDPIYVHVMLDRWDSYGPKTWRSTFLHKLLEKSGGISDTVLPGWYTYNAKVEGLEIIATLEPYTE